MSLSNQLSVFVQTHIIRANNEPYVKNEMIVETIKQSYEKLDLKDVRYYFYADAKFYRTHPELMQQYLEYLDSITQLEDLKDIHYTKESS